MTVKKNKKTKKNGSLPLCCPSNWVLELYHQLLGQSWMTFIICLFFQASSHGSCTFEKENQIYNADEKWVNVPVDCFVSIASVGIFFYSSHSPPCNPFTSCLTGEHWLCLIMGNNPREKKSCQTSGRWFIRKSTKRNSKCYSSYISSLQFRLLFPVWLDDGLAYQILDMQVAAKEMRESPTPRQPKQCFCIIQNQCIFLLWSRFFRRIILSPGLISFQWIVHLFVNTFMYLLDDNFICWIALSTLWWYSKHPQNWNGQWKLGSNSRQLFQTNLWHFSG